MSKITTVLWVCAAVVGIAAAAVGRAATLGGAVSVKGELRARASGAVRGSYVNEWNGFVEPKASTMELERELTIVLVGAEATKDSALAALQNGQLSPTTIVMQQGTSLRVRNDDDFTHQLYASDVKGFDPIETSAGQSRLLQIDQAGAFEVRDKLAPHVRGTLVVLPKLTRAFTPHADGKFQQGELAPGSYQLKVFCRGKELASRAVELNEGRELDLEPIEVDVTGLE